MNLELNYPDALTFVSTEADGYSGKRVVTQQVEVNCVFIQNTDFVRSGFQENIDADAIAVPDFNNAFIQEHFNRLEGLYIIAALFGADAVDSWYKVETCVVNRDHLLTNSIDNIDLLLKKTRSIPGVS